ncbi:hypothetical protein [Polyangium sp. y55x31]|uniref:hypothetical protein n=1 Tax=Polyangium sp. y55x31 TaxID=3042688 RepID=UPI0024830401|nr:hypothetical protein [Polyangium sp. y55x31]MDI1483277.1 hypothetical protein [Polyangium sp. y55x31]
MSDNPFDRAANDIIAGLHKQQAEAEREASATQEREAQAKTKAAQREAGYTTIANLIIIAMENLQDSLLKQRANKASVSRASRTIRIGRHEVPSLAHMTMSIGDEPDFGRPVPDNDAVIGLARGDVGGPSQDMLLIYYKRGKSTVEWHIEHAIDPTFDSPTVDELREFVLSAARKASGHG